MGACIMVQSKQFWKIQCERCKSNHEFTVIGLHNHRHSASSHSSPLKMMEEGQAQPNPTSVTCLRQPICISVEAAFPVPELKSIGLDL